METLVRLKGKTLKGKNRVREHGDVWRVTKIAENSGGLIQKGDFLIEPIEQKGRWPESRWVTPASDKDFEVELI